MANRNNIMGKHIDEHNLLVDKLTQCEVNADVVFRKWHNGDAEINDIVRSNRDDIRDAKQMIAAHIRGTSGDDDKLANYDKYHKYIILLIGALIASFARHAYTIFMI